MENLKVNETRGKITAHLNSDDTPGYFKLNVVHCNTNCCYYSKSGCMGVLSETGDCQRRYRKDHQSVYFTKN